MSPARDSLNEIPTLLAQLARDVQAALRRQPGDVDRRALQQLLVWTLGHQRRFEAVLHRLEGSSDAALLRDWLAHAPALQQCTNCPGPADALGLQCRAAALEVELFALIGQLLQHSGGSWASDLYRGLLDHALAGTPQPARQAC